VRTSPASRSSTYSYARSIEPPVSAMSSMMRTSSPLDAPLGHRIADGRLAGFLGGADVVFHLQARQVVQSEEVTETPPREPAAPGQRDDDVRLERRRRASSSATSRHRP